MGIVILINLALRTEFSFKRTLQHVKKITDGQKIAVGIADFNTTFGHVKLEQQCKKAGIKPIFGVRLMVVDDPDARPKGQQGNFGPIYIFLAKNQNGLQEMYSLVKTAYDNFFFRPHLSKLDLVRTSDNIIVISTSTDLYNRADYLGVTPSTPKRHLNSDEPKVFINDNSYPSVDQKGVYQLMAGARKSGTGYSFKFEEHTYPGHILSDQEFSHLAPGVSFEGIMNTSVIAEQCNVELPKAEMVHYKGKRTVEKWCISGAIKRDIDLTDPAYSERLERELDLIESKDYGDYFLNVAEIIAHAKKTMLVGPSRGSSAGSLVCYLMEITEIDPIPYGLLFERFIDINRFDLPDIDIDFPDKKRGKVIKHIEKTHGPENVYHIATVSRFMPKSAIGDFAMGLGIPKYETEAVKGAIIERSGGDARAAMCIADTFESDVGKEFIKKYPAMKLTSFIEGHASHSGVHAAGVIVCNDAMTNYGGVNTRDRTIMMDKHDAEYAGLLKIDCLGLRTLSVLEDCAKLAGFKFNKFYDLPLDDEAAFNVFNTMRVQGIFQFEGHSLQFITRQIGVHKFDDIVAITALARPGAMNSGGTGRYVKYKLGEDRPTYRGEIHKKITEESMGIVIYQEQMMSMAKEIGNMSWEEVSTLRKAASKSLGDEFFSQFKEKFVKGATEDNGYSELDAEALWQDISATGSWTFNKSHAVSYGLVSYWTAWAKAHHPLEFAAANLNNARDEDSAVRLLRDFVKNDGIEYTAFDADNSDINWSIANGRLIGGLTSIKGIGLKKAQEIKKKRDAGKGFTPAVVQKMFNPDTVFSDIFPCTTRFGDLYESPKKHGVVPGPVEIEMAVEEGYYTVIGKVKLVDLRDRNDYQSVVKRGGTKVTSNQFYLKLFIEDDTDSIMIMIPPNKFEELQGKLLSETLKVDETWLLVRGSMKSDWRMITAEAIFDLEDWTP